LNNTNNPEIDINEHNEIEITGVENINISNDSENYKTEQITELETK